MEGESCTWVDIVSVPPAGVNFCALLNRFRKIWQSNSQKKRRNHHLSMKASKELKGMSRLDSFEQDRRCKHPSQHQDASQEPTCQESEEEMKGEAGRQGRGAREARLQLHFSVFPARCSCGWEHEPSRVQGMRPIFPAKPEWGRGGQRSNAFLFVLAHESSQGRRRARCKQRQGEKKKTTLDWERKEGTRKRHLWKGFLDHDTKRVGRIQKRREDEKNWLQGTKAKKGKERHTGWWKQGHKRTTKRMQAHTLSKLVGEGGKKKRLGATGFHFTTITIVFSHVHAGAKGANRSLIGAAKQSAALEDHIMNRARVTTRNLNFKLSCGGDSAISNN